MDGKGMKISDDKESNVDKSNSKLWRAVITYVVKEYRTQKNKNMDGKRAVNVQALYLDRKTDHKYFGKLFNLVVTFPSHFFHFVLLTVFHLSFIC